MKSIDVFIQGGEFAEILVSQAAPIHSIAEILASFDMSLLSAIARNSWSSSKTRTRHSIRRRSWRSSCPSPRPAEAPCDAMPSC